MRRLSRRVEQNHLTDNETRSQVQVDKLLLICVCILSFTPNYGLGRSVLRPHNSNSAQRNVKQLQVRLVLQTSRAVYRIGEPIETVVYLENISSDSSYYVGRRIDGVVIPPSFHGIEFTLSDDTGKKILLPRGAADSSPTTIYGINGKQMPPARQTIIEKLMHEYVLLGPRAIYGFRREIGEPTLKPGRYHLRAAYYEAEALSWTEDERKGLPFPVVMQTLTSNAVTIIIVP